MLKKLISEFAGTFFLVFAGTGAIIVNAQTNGVIGHVGIAATFGIVIMLMVYSFGNVSGAHLNPAVTFALWSSGKFPLKEIPGYIFAQLVGAFAASLSLKWFFPTDTTKYGTCLPYNDSWKMAFGMEFILTFILVFVILRVIADREKLQFAGLIIGGAIFLDALFGGPASGASMNPARALAPAVVSGTYKHLWAYLAAPIGGAIVASIIHSVFYKEED
jgi:MIP family channel proteins